MNPVGPSSSAPVSSFCKFGKTFLDEENVRRKRDISDPYRRLTATDGSATVSENKA